MMLHSPKSMILRERERDNSQWPLDKKYGATEPHLICFFESSSKFSGLRSRCATSLRWQYATPSCVTNRQHPPLRPPPNQSTHANLPERPPRILLADVLVRHNVVEELAALDKLEDEIVVLLVLQHVLQNGHVRVVQRPHHLHLALYPHKVVRPADPRLLEHLSRFVCRVREGTTSDGGRAKVRHAGRTVPTARNRGEWGAQHGTQWGLFREHPAKSRRRPACGDHASARLARGTRNRDAP